MGARGSPIILYNRVCSDENLRPTIEAKCPPIFQKLMADCWARNPADRPTFTQIAKRLQDMSAMPFSEYDEKITTSKQLNVLFNQVDELVSKLRNDTESLELVKRRCADVMHVISSHTGEDIQEVEII